MSKIKTRRAAAKRFKKTANGFKHRRTNKSHILTKKGKKRKRHLRGTDMVGASNLAAVEKMLNTQVTKNSAKNKKASSEETEK